MSDSLQDMLQALHSEVADCLLKKIREGTATAADLGVARQFLKDNGIDSVPVEGSKTFKLSEAMPFPDPESEENTA